MCSSKDKQESILFLVEPISSRGLEWSIGKAKGRPQGPQLDDVLRKKVVKLRERYDWGPNKIAAVTSATKASILTITQLIMLSAKPA